MYNATPVGEVVEIYGRNKRKDGTTFPVHVRFCKLDDIYAIANVRDITKQELLDDELEVLVSDRAVELHLSETKVRLLLDSTSQALYGLDLEGRCTFCNSACIDILGYELESDLMGKIMHDLIHYERIDGSKYPNEECEIYKAFRSNRGTHVDD